MTDFYGKTDDALWRSLHDATLSERAETLQHLAHRHMQHKKWRHAIALLEAAKDAFTQLAVSSDVAVCTNWIARCLAQIGETEQSIAQHKEVLTSLVEHDPTHEWVGMTLDAIGCEYWDLGLRELAGSWFAQAARQHEANDAPALAVDSARKWIAAMQSSQKWDGISEAADIIVHNSEHISDHIRAHVGRIQAACAGALADVDVAAVLAKCDRLISSSGSEQAHFDVDLAHVVVMRHNGDWRGASERALAARAEAKSRNSVAQQAEFLLQAAACVAPQEPERAETFLRVAKDLAEVLGNSFIEDRAEASLIELHERMAASSETTCHGQQPLW